MLEVSIKKNKVNLADYNCKLDIENRSLLSDLSFFEHDVLQEIFYSPLKFSCKKIARNLNCDEKKLLPILLKFSKSGLLTIDDDTVTVDKEMRKSFEFHMKRFEEDFKPDMEYLQGILRKVPIHVLPLWYAIPRTSNNIFESIVEKYLLTPHSYQRYLSELSFTNPLASRVMHDIFNSPDCKMASCDIITKYNLTRAEFEEILLLLEFSFVACVTYTRGVDIFLEWVTPFHEWQEYLLFFKNTEISPVSAKKEIQRDKKSDFWFVEALAESLQKNKTTEQILQNKIQLLNFSSEEVRDFLKLTTEKQALYLYRHPLNRMTNPSILDGLATEKNVRETEKSIRRVSKRGWVFFDDFLKGMTSSLNDNAVNLQRVGKLWKYTLPSYTPNEIHFMKLVIFEWLSECGIVATGKCEGKDCFTLTAFGRFFFED